MKKLIIFLFIIMIPINIKAEEKIDVTLSKCVDGDTAWFILDNKKIKTRFLAIDTPESTTEIEEYGKEASNFTCNKLKSAKTIEIEYDIDSDKVDKYDRHLVWIFVDGKLLQDLIIQEGLAEIKYIYGDYKYLDQLNNSLEKAKKNKKNMWSISNDYINILNYSISKETFYTGITVIIVLVLCIFSKNIRKKVKNKTKSKIRKQINKKIDDLF